MIGAEDSTKVCAGEGVPTVWVEASAPLLGNPEASACRRYRAKRARAFFTDPGALPPDPQPVDAAGAAAAPGRPWKQKTLPRPPTARLEISGETGDFPSPLENANNTAFSTSDHRPSTAVDHNKTNTSKRTGLTPLNYVSTETG